MRLERLGLSVVAGLTLVFAPGTVSGQSGEQRIRAEDVPGIRSRASRDFRFELFERQDRMRERQSPDDWALGERRSREIERGLEREQRVREQQTERAQAARERIRERQLRSRQLQERAWEREVERALERAMQAREGAERRREEARMRAAMRVRWQ